MKEDFEPWQQALRDLISEWLTRTGASIRLLSEKSAVAYSTLHGCYAMKNSISPHFVYQILDIVCADEEQAREFIGKYFPGQARFMSRVYSTSHDMASSHKTPSDIQLQAVTRRFDLGEIECRLIEKLADDEMLDIKPIEYLLGKSKTDSFIKMLVSACLADVENNKLVSTAYQLTVLSKCKGILQSLSRQVVSDIDVEKDGDLLEYESQRVSKETAIQIWHELYNAFDKVRKLVRSPENAGDVRVNLTTALKIEGILNENP